jgi:hypothetical protein
MHALWAQHKYMSQDPGATDPGPDQTTVDVTPGTGMDSAPPVAANQPPAGTLPAGAYLATDGHVWYPIPAGPGYMIPPRFGRSQGEVSALVAQNPGLDWTTLPVGYYVQIPDAWVPDALVGQPGTQTDITPVSVTVTPGSSPPTGTTTTTTTDDGGLTYWQKVGIGVGVVALLGGGAWLVMRARKGKRRSRR